MSFNVLASQSIFSKPLKIVLLILINCKPLITSAPLIEMKYIFIFILFSSLSMAAAQTLQRYAITAAESSGDGLQKGISEGEMMYWDGAAWVTIPPGAQGQTLTFCNGKPHWGPCP